MVVAQVVGIARGKTPVIGDHARMRPEDLSDMHRHVLKIPTMTTARSELDLLGDCPTCVTRCIELLSHRTINPPQL